MSRNRLLLLAAVALSAIQSLPAAAVTVTYYDCKFNAAKTACACDKGDYLVNIYGLCAHEAALAFQDNNNYTALSSAFGSRLERLPISRLILPDTNKK